jgi:hypothetical protein
VGPDVAVEAMMSNTGHVFYGDLRSHERVVLNSYLLPRSSQLGRMRNSH